MFVHGFAINVLRKTLVCIEHIGPTFLSLAIISFSHTLLLNFCIFSATLYRQEQAEVISPTFSLLGSSCIYVFYLNSIHCNFMISNYNWWNHPKPSEIMIISNWVTTRNLSIASFKKKVSSFQMTIHWGGKSIICKFSFIWQ